VGIYILIPRRTPLGHLGLGIIFKLIVIDHGFGMVLATRMCVRDYYI